MNQIQEIPIDSNNYQMLNDVIETKDSLLIYYKVKGTKSNDEMFLLLDNSSFEHINFKSLYGKNDFNLADKNGNKFTCYILSKTNAKPNLTNGDNYVVFLTNQKKVLR